MLNLDTLDFASWWTRWCHSFWGSFCGISTLLPHLFSTAIWISPSSVDGESSDCVCLYWKTVTSSALACLMWMLGKRKFMRFRRILWFRGVKESSWSNRRSMIKPPVSREQLLTVLVSNVWILCLEGLEIGSIWARNNSHSQLNLNVFNFVFV